MALYLGNNAMGDTGITALADGLRFARGLQKLHVNDNEVIHEQKIATISLGFYRLSVCRKVSVGWLHLPADWTYPMRVSPSSHQFCQEIFPILRCGSSSL